MEWILLDKDGTLTESDHSWEKTDVCLINSFLETFPVTNKEATLHRPGVVKDTISPDSVMSSGSLDEIIHTFNDESGKDIPKWTRDTSQTLVDSREPENNWVDGVYDMVQSLWQEGYRIGIMTSDSERGVTQSLEETHSKDASDLVISAEAHAARKPDPEILRPLFNHYDIKPEDVAIVGDIDNDMKIEVNAELGLVTGVLSGITKKKELADVDYVIEVVVSVPEILEKYTQNN